MQKLHFLKSFEATNVTSEKVLCIFLTPKMGAKAQLRQS